MEKEFYSEIVESRYEKKVEKKEHEAEWDESDPLASQWGRQSKYIKKKCPKCGVHSWGNLGSGKMICRVYFCKEELGEI